MTQITSNPVVYFEIPVTDIERAISFYQYLFSFTFTREFLDGYEMAFFPMNNRLPGATGALAKGDPYKPSIDGAVIYFYTEDIDSILAKATELGAPILYPKTINLDYHFIIAELQDSEGNRIALKQNIFT